jgi:hypothetical protein
MANIERLRKLRKNLGDLISTYTTHNNNKREQYTLLNLAFLSGDLWPLYT